MDLTTYYILYILTQAFSPALSFQTAAGLTTRPDELVNYKGEKQ